MIQPILDFLLSFFKLSTNKILIGLLSIGLAVSLTFNINQGIEHNKERLLDKEEKDSLRTAIVNVSVQAAAKETALYKEFYEKLEKLSDKKNKDK